MIGVLVGHFIARVRLARAVFDAVDGRQGLRWGRISHGRLRLGVLLARAGLLFVGTLASREVGLEVVGPDEVLDVQECGAFLTDVDERGLHPRQDAGDLS